MLRSVLNSIGANIAVLDRHGTIIATNEAWERFALEDGIDATPQRVGAGANYLEACERDTRDLGEERQQIAASWTWLQEPPNLPYLLLKAQRAQRIAVTNTKFVAFKKAA